MKSPVKDAKELAKKGPKRHHFYYVLIVVCGWFLPPLAVLVRFGVGKDFFLNIILTILGYFPGHFHNFYLQNIRNNKGRHRTPKWAIKAGLVKVKDERSKPKHQWANRYEERHATNNYNDGTDSLDSNSPPNSTWDGRGPEPPPKEDVYSNSNKRHHGWAPWGTEVQADEVEVGPSRMSSRSKSQNDLKTKSKNGIGGIREEFYETDGRQDSNLSSGPNRTPSNGQPSTKFRSLVTGTNKTNGGAREVKSGDRFDRMERARKRVGSGSEMERGNPDWERRENYGYHDEEYRGDGYNVGQKKSTATANTQRSNVDDLNHNF